MKQCTPPYLVLWCQRILQMWVLTTVPPGPYLRFGSWSWVRFRSPDSEQDLGPCLDTLVVPLLHRPRDPAPADENRNMRRKLETNPDDENSRSAVRLRFTCAQSHAGVSAWFAEGISASEKDHEVKCKSGSTSARIVFASKAMCQ